MISSPEYPHRISTKYGKTPLLVFTTISKTRLAHKSPAVHIWQQRCLHGEHTTILISKIAITSEAPISAPPYEIPLEEPLPVPTYVPSIPTSILYPRFPQNFPFKKPPEYRTSILQESSPSELSLEEPPSVLHPGPISISSGDHSWLPYQWSVEIPIEEPTSPHVISPEDPTSVPDSEPRYSPRAEP